MRATWPKVSESFALRGGDQSFFLGWRRIGFCRENRGKDWYWPMYSETKQLKPLGRQVITVMINGEKQEFEAGLTVADLLIQLNLNSQAIAVEINQQVRPRDSHRTTQIEAGDVLEIVTLVGGG